MIIVNLGGAVLSAIGLYVGVRRLKRNVTRRAVFVAAIVLSVGARRTAPSVMAQAADAATHKTWMNDAADAQEDLRDALHGKKTADAATASAKIEGLLAKAESYWAGKRAHDIVKLAQESRAFAKQIATGAKAGKWKQAETAFGAMNTRCNTCHDLHPEKR